MKEHSLRKDGLAIWRPFLHVGRQDLSAWADRHNLTWIEDPSNDDTAFDRNHIRHVVLPALRHRWPDAAAVLGQAAARQADAHDLEQAVAQAVLERARTGDAAVLRIAPLRVCSRPERWAALRLWLGDRGARDIGAARLTRIDRELLDAAIDADPRIDLGPVVLRRHRDHLHAVRAGADATVRYRTSWTGLAPLALPGDVGVLRIEPAPDEPLPLIVGSREGGERLRLHAAGPRRKLKHLLQEAGVPGWHRQRWPVIRLDDEVVAFADRIVGHALQSRLDRLRCSLRFTAH